MKRLLSILAFAALACQSFSQTATTRALLYTQVDTNLPSGTGLVTAAQLRLTLKNIIASSYVPSTDGAFSFPLAVSLGGTGTANPALQPGTSIGITGTFPNQTISYTGSGGGGGGGSGDMLRSTYDTNTDGIVDVAALANSVAWSNVAGKPTLAPSATSDTTNAANITSGTLPVARLPALTGGDATTSAGSGAVTLVNSGVTAGNYGSSTQIPVITVDSKGRLTSASSVTSSGGAGTASSTRSTVTDSTLASLASVGSAIYHTSSTVWALSKGDAQSTARVDALVESISGSNVTIVYGGSITLSGLTTGSQYYLSDATAGLTTATAPTNVNSYLTPVFVATSATSAIVSLPGYTALAKITNADLATAGALTVKGNLTGSSGSVSDNTVSTLNAALDPQDVTQTGSSYTVQASDMRMSVVMNNAGANTLIIPTNATAPIPVGAWFIGKQGGLGTTTIAPASGVTIHTAGSLVLGAQYAYFSARKVLTDTWEVLSQPSAGSGTVTSIGIVPPSWLSASAAITTSGNITITPTAGQTANQFVATPNGSSGGVGLRAIVAGDLPALTGGNVTSSAGSGVLTIGSGVVTNAMLAGSIDASTKLTNATPIANGGSGATTAAAARVNLTPASNAISASAIDWAVAGTHSKTLAANTTFTFSNSVDGETIIVAVTNTASNYTVNWPTVKWTGGVSPVQTTGVHTDIYTFVNVSGTIYGAANQNF